MKHFIGWRPVQLMAGAALAFLAQGVIAPPIAEASCGHYVFSGVRTESGQPPTVQNVPAEGLPPSVPAAPCTGPMCSRPMPAPLTAPAPPVRALQDFCADDLN